MGSNFQMEWPTSLHDFKLQCNQLTAFSQVVFVSQEPPESLAWKKRWSA